MKLKGTDGSLRAERGAAIPMVLGVASFLLIIAAVAIGVAQSDLSLSAQETEYVQAAHVAEAGIDDYVWHLIKDPLYYETAVHPAEGQNAQGNERHKALGDGTYHLEITPPLPGENAVVIEATGKVGDVERTVQVTVTKKSFLDYLYFTNTELLGGNRKIWFIGGDVIHGPVHSNGNIHMARGSPIFEGRVTTGGVIERSWGASPNFQQGYEERVSTIPLPQGNQALKEEARRDGFYYFGRTTVNLYSGGKMLVTNYNRRSTGPTRRRVSLPANGVVYVDGSRGDVYVRGTLNGKLTIAAYRNIYITGNLEIADKSEASDDLLGLVSNNDILIRHDPRRRIYAPYNIEIDAGLLAVNGSFGLQNYWRGPARGTLTVRGAIVQESRGAVGTFSRRTGRRASGYSKDYWYDERFQHRQPPYFLEPVNSSYEEVLWNEVAR